LRANGRGCESHKALLHRLASRPMFERFLEQADDQEATRGVA